MTPLKDKIENSLNESRILVLGMQVLIAFELRSPLERRFDELSPHLQRLNLAGLALLLFAFGVLLHPPAYHRLVERGNDSEALHRVIVLAVEAALVPLAAALGIDLTLAVAREAGATVGAIAGAALTLTALGCWFGVMLVHRHRSHTHDQAEVSRMSSDEKPGPTPLGERIKQVLTEARVVLPGAQALLGFQFASTFMEGYDKLPASSRWTHLGSLVLVALSVVLLMAPPAYHRIVEHGEDTERFNTFASRMLLAAMVPLALGMCGDFFVVARKTTGNDPWSLGLACALFALFLTLWFGVPLWERARRAHAATLDFVQPAR